MLISWFVNFVSVGICFVIYVQANSESFVVKTLDRKTLWEMQTPQVFLVKAFMTLIPLIVFKRAQIELYNLFS